MKQKFAVIACPHCGYEYLPAEIFYPDEFFGKPHHLLRTQEGKIFDFMGTSLNPREKYVCDNCDKEFKINTRIMFISMKEDNTDEFEEEYSTPLNKESLFLNEGEDDENEETEGKAPEKEVQS